MRGFAVVFVAAFVAVPVQAGYVNFESGHVHPIALTPSGGRLLVVNTPDALLEVYSVQPDGGIQHERVIPVGLEPVTVAARTDGEAWVVNNLSDSISIVDLNLGLVVRTLPVGDEPTDVVFARDLAFVAVSSEDAVWAYELPPNDPLAIFSVFSRDVRALAVANDESKVYAVTLRSGNQTTSVNANIVHDLPLNGPNHPPGEELHEGFYQTFNMGRPGCDGAGPPHPPTLPDGIVRNPDLEDPLPPQLPQNSIIVRWDEGTQSWRDEVGSDWTHCVRFKLPDNDLFIIDTDTGVMTEVAHLGTTLFEVSVHPTNGKVYVPNTDALNFKRFEHPLGLRGHFVDNLLSVVDPANGNTLTRIDLNTHIDRTSDPETNLAERLASVSQPGMLAWKSDGSVAYLTAIGSHKVFRVDGNCLSGACIFGADRAVPAAIEVGLGPTGVALRESAQPENERLYVLNRISHSLAIVKTSTFELLEEIPLHDPSSEAIRSGRRLLYESALASAHGDASCASCHPSGDMDGLAWELGNPEAPFVSYERLLNNVRFVFPGGEFFSGASDLCDLDLSECADHAGFDPQKGPMVTQTLRGMLEPLHWRGDRPTFRDFDQTFVDLLGAAAPPSGPAMEAFRQFALEIGFPPNPHRNVDDSLPCGPRATDPDCEVRTHGATFPGNPTEGERIFHSGRHWAGDRNCTVCHRSSFGSFGGKLGGVEPTVPTSDDVTRLKGGLVLTEFPVRHVDVEVPHLRNLYEKFGPWLSPAGGLIDVTAGFGYTHDGSISDLSRFCTNRLFSLEPDNQWQGLRDLVSFLFAFPTGTKPSVGRQVTLAAGTPPTGSTEDEALLATLVGLGDSSDEDRHCELVAATVADSRLRNYHYSGGLWRQDTALDPPLSMQQLREGAQAPVTFTCATLGSGPRLGGDRDDDTSPNIDDCAPTDAGTFAAPNTVSGALMLEVDEGFVLRWDDQGPLVGPGVRYEVLGATLSDLFGIGLLATNCLASDPGTQWVDERPDPPAGDGYYYLVRAVNVCGTGDLGPDREVVETVVCP